MSYHNIRVKYDWPKNLDRSNYVYFYIVTCAMPSEQESRNFSPARPKVVYDRTFDCIDSARARQKEILERSGQQSFWTVGKPCFGAFY